MNPELNDRYEWQGQVVRIVGIHNWPTGTRVDIERVGGEVAHLVRWASQEFKKI